MMSTPPDHDAVYEDAGHLGLSPWGFCKFMTVPAMSLTKIDLERR